MYVAPVPAEHVEEDVGARLAEVAMEADATVVFDVDRSDVRVVLDDDAEDKGVVSVFLNDDVDKADDTGGWICIPASVKVS